MPGQIDPWVGSFVAEEMDIMQGLITERHFASAEKWFPGIRHLYQTMANKPLTFLELVWEYERQMSRCIGAGEPRCGSAGRRVR